MNMDAFSSLRNLLNSKNDYIASAAPENERINAILSETLAALDSLELESKDIAAKQEAARLILANLDTLAADSVLGDTPSELQILAHAQSVLLPFFASKVSGDLPKYTLVVPPPLSRHPTLDPEVASTLSSLAFLHTLVTHPQRVLTPGKSLRSALASPQVIKALGGDPASMGIPDEQTGTREKRKSMQEAISEIAHRAFWDEALEALSSPLPSIQLARLRRLYQDLYTALTSSSPPLLPPSHSILATLSCPPSPTSAPLTSAVRHLRELVSALRERCAPVRDEALDRVLASLHNNPVQYQAQVSTDTEDIATSSRESMARAIVNATRSLLDIIAQMQTDLKAFMLASIPDSDLRSTLRETASDGEREAVLKLYGGEERVKTQWREWIITANNSQEADKWTWIRRLVDAFGADVPVACPLPSGSQDEQTSDSSINSTETTDQRKRLLPPPFLFSIPDLVRVQNYTQALIITAVLRTLIPMSSRSPNPHSPETDDGQKSFTERILTLLAQEIDTSNTDANGNSDSTKLAHLTEEVIRERQRIANSTHSSSLHSLPVPPSLSKEGVSSHNPEPDDEVERMRMAVSGLLRADAGAFKLLRSRLLAALPDAIISSLTTPTVPSAPTVMRTGTAGERPGKRPRLGSPLHIDLRSSAGQSGEMEDKIEVADVRVRGFEGDRALQDALKEIVKDLVRELNWVREVWGVMLEI